MDEVIARFSPPAVYACLNTCICNVYMYTCICIYVYPYLLGCYGGWIYPEGRYAEEFGFIDETCSTYNGEESYTCTRDKNCIKYYATNYRYIGPYFGA